MNILALGAMINSALYLAGCFVTGLVLGVHLVSALAIISAGLAYLAYCMMLAQNGDERLWELRFFRIIVTSASIAVGAGAGFAALLVLI